MNSNRKRQAASLTEPVRIFRDDRQGLLSLKSNPRETFGDVIHRLIAEELARHPERFPGRSQEAVAA